MTLSRLASPLINNLRRNHYKLLGIKRTDDKKEIKTAYLKQAKLLHPDSNPGDPNAQEKFQSLQKAYETLKNEDSRREYDMTLGDTSTGDFFKERGGYDIYTNEDDDPPWFRGRTESERGTRFSYASPDFDPWSHDFRNNRARKFWEEMEEQFGNPNYDYYYTEHRNIYDEFDTESYRQMEREWENAFREEMEDLNWNYNPRNKHHQRYSYDEREFWESQKEAYEAEFKAYQEAYRNSREFNDERQSKRNTKKSRKEKQKNAQRQNYRYSSADNYENDNYENMFNRTYGFNRTDGFSGRNIWESNMYEDDYMDQWDTWTESAYSETSQDVDRKNRKGKKINKKNKQRNPSKTNAASEFYAKINKNGQTVIDIDGEKFKVQMKNGELKFTKVK